MDNTLTWPPHNTDTIPTGAYAKNYKVYFPQFILSDPLIMKKKKSARLDERTHTHTGFYNSERNTTHMYSCVINKSSYWYRDHMIRTTTGLMTHRSSATTSGIKPEEWAAA